MFTVMVVASELHGCFSPANITPWVFLLYGFSWCEDSFFVPQSGDLATATQQHLLYRPVKLVVTTILHCYVSKRQIEFGDFVITSAKRQKKLYLLRCLCSIRASQQLPAGRQEHLQQFASPTNTTVHSRIYGRLKPPIHKVGAARVAAFPPMTSVLMFIEYFIVL